jgi:CDP-paratose 2-epimerase
MSNAKGKNRLKRNGAAVPGLRINGSSRSETLRADVTNRPVLITGGAGFIGTNLADRLLSNRRPVILYDNLSRPGVEQNLAWLREKHGDLIQHDFGDVRDFRALRRSVRKAGMVFHFAAQVAVTTSLQNPIEDFEINARGTLNLLEALRTMESPPPLVFTSTNKVYGDLSQVSLRMTDGRYEPEDQGVREHGLNESFPLYFHSPYGCSKGAACQYAQDYARTFGLKTVVFRMSCIYGPHQFGTEDQGWVAHFLIKALANSPITIYGDGRQVRDILYVEDLVDAFLLAEEHMDQLSGEVFNIGGGVAHTTSLLELMELIGELQRRTPEVRFADWRSADQKYYVSDIRRFTAATGWAPRMSLGAGVRQLYHWLQEFQRVDGMRVLHLPASGTRNGSRAGSRLLRPKISLGHKLTRLKAARATSGARASRAEQKLAKAFS